MSQETPLLAENRQKKPINMNTHHQVSQVLAECSRHDMSAVVMYKWVYLTLEGSLLSAFDFSQSLSEIRVFKLVWERCDICYYAFQKVVFGDLFAGLENEFNITGLESIGFIISITIALSDTKLSFKHPNDTLKFNEILSPANI